MNVQQEALLKFLNEKDIKFQYFYSEDFKLICEKSLVYQKKNKKMPSIDFLIEYSSKISEDREQAERISDILYACSKLKPKLEDTQEINELLLDNYKKETIKGLTKQMTSALVDDNQVKVARLSEQITEVSKIELSGEDFRDNDIKKDLDKSSLKVELISSGFLPTAHDSISKIARGSVISLIANTGFGKSILSINACTNQYLNGHNTVYLSYELPKPVVLARIISSISEVAVSEIMASEYSTDEAELRVEAAKAVLRYEIEFDKAFNRVLKNKSFEDCTPRNNYLKIIAIQSSGTHEVDTVELPNNEAILNMLEEYNDCDFFTIDLISEVQFVKSSGSYEADLSNFVRELKAKALKHSSVIIVISQPSSDSVGGIRFPKYCKAIRSSADSNLIISATPELLKDNLSVLIAEKVRHSFNGLAIPMVRRFDIMKFEHMVEENNLNMEAYFVELSKVTKLKDKQ